MTADSLEAGLEEQHYMSDGSGIYLDWRVERSMKTLNFHLVFILLCCW